MKTLIETAQLKRAAALAQAVKDAPTSRIGMILGSPGTGKTSASHWLAETQGAMRVCCMEGMSRLDIAREAAEALGLSSAGTYGEIMRRVKKDLNTRDDIPLLVVDESDELNQRSLNVLRHLADESRCAVLLCGSEILEQTFAMPRSGAYLARMTSRIGTKRVSFSKLSLKALAKYILAPRFGKAVTEQSAKQFYKHCQGNWRRAEDLAHAVDDVLKLNPKFDSQFTAEAVEIAAATLSNKPIEEAE
jgi:DNA transposition AAA+ family ATPase